MNRGSVVIIDFPFTSGNQSKVRPALVVQNDGENARLTKTIVAMITGNLRRSAEPTHVVLDQSTPDGASCGLHGVSLVSCINLYTVEQACVKRTVGKLSPPLMARVDASLRKTLSL